MPATKTAAPKSAAKAKIASAIPHVAPEAEVTDSGMFDDVMGAYTRAQDALLKFFAAPSWKRTLVAVITYAIGVVGLGFASSALVDCLMIGATSMGAPVFLAVAIAVLGVVLVAYYGHRVVMRVAGAVLTGEADERAAAAYGACKNMFRRLNPFVKMVPADSAE